MYPNTRKHPAGTKNQIRLNQKNTTYLTSIDKEKSRKFEHSRVTVLINYLSNLNLQGPFASYFFLYFSEKDL